MEPTDKPMESLFHLGKRKTKTTDMLSTASEVWAFLKQDGGLSLDSYDKELPDELFESLRKSFPATTATGLDSLLNTNAVPVEDFLVAFFKVVQPFADMMVDLLRLFEEAKANQGKLNLAVRFNFDKDLPPLQFDLNHFRKWQETWQRVAGVFLANLWNQNSLWQLNGLLRSVDARVRDSRMQRWLAIYSDGKNGRGHFADEEPPTPQSGVSELDATFERVWRVWLTVVRQSKRFGSDREELNRRWHSEMRDERIQSEREGQQELVEEAVARRFASTSSRMPVDSMPAIQRGTLAGEIVLRWGNFPNDLDLHLRIFHGGQPSEVSYSSLGSIADAPWAQLDHDIQRAHGQETIRISRWLDGPYRGAVHNYSGERQLAGCGATVTVGFGKQELQFECPTSGTGVWWDLFSYSPATGKFEIVNRVTNSF